MVISILCETGFISVNNSMCQIIRTGCVNSAFLKGGVTTWLIITLTHTFMDENSGM